MSPQSRWNDFTYTPIFFTVRVERLVAMDQTTNRNTGQPTDEVTAILMAEIPGPELYLDEGTPSRHPAFPESSGVCPSITTLLSND